jgi:uncharacterized protein (DUF1810 family)
MSIGDPFQLQRFVEAQQGMYEQVRSELAAGEKRSHWMWFIFPQMAGLGLSETSKRYAIKGLDEARAYLRHPVLGPRLRECTALVNTVKGKSIDDIFSSPDDMKFRSSITLFAGAEDDAGSVFVEALRKYFNGVPDEDTLTILTAIA